MWSPKIQDATAFFAFPELRVIAAVMFILATGTSVEELWHSRAICRLTAPF